MRVRRIQLQVGLSTQGRGVSGLEVEDAPTQRLKIRDALFDAAQHLVQLFGQMRADRLVSALAVDGGDFSNLLQCQPQRAQAADHLYAPQGRFVKQTIVALASAKRIQQAQALVLAQGFDRHATAPGELPDGQRFRLEHGYAFLSTNDIAPFSRSSASSVSPAFTQSVTQVSM